MSDRSRASLIHPGSQSEPERRRQLQRAADRLEAVLQSLDLEEETRLADEVAEAIRATDRAYELELELENEEAKAGRGSGEFVFPSALTDGGSARDR